MSRTENGHIHRGLRRIRRFLSALVPAVTLTSAAALYGQGRQTANVQRLPVEKRIIQTPSRVQTKPRTN
jgi:hypothetical protein